ncbi:MAG: LLM class flavin-dependent oxidoreductase [Chloroflexota bacterium]|nr:LLM class flavin-dependent oxidoreductase [Chloroflexota bacterium]
MADGHRLRFGIVLGQRAAWEVLAGRARETEALGFDSFMLVDHFYGLFDVMEPTHEAYTVLAAIATVTNRVRLGIMVSGNTYRNPALLLKQAITVDDISGGRLDFGVGSGWTEREHEAYGFPFPSAGDRVGMFAEALEIWQLLQSRERTTFDGRYYQLLDAPFEPKSAQGRLPVLIGASLPRMLRLTARYADIWNARGTPEEAGAGNQSLTRMCGEVGRDPAAIVRGVSPAWRLLDSVDEFVAGVAAYRAVGFTDFQLPWPRDDRQYEVMREVTREIMPALQRESERAPGSD